MMRVSVVASPVVSGVSVVVPVMAIAYIDTHMQAVLDARGLHRRVGEVQIFLDEARLSVDKAFADATTWADAQLLTVDKALLDSVGLPDVFSRQVDYVRGFQEAVALADTSARTTGKQLTEAVAFSDASMRSSGKNVAETVTYTDVYSRTLGKKTVDSVAFTDAYAATVNKKHTESVGFTDASTRTLQKNLSDSFGLNESVRWFDGTSAGFRKFLSNIFTPIDAAKAIVGKKQSDSVGFTDSGSLISQGYVDPSYFAQPYVGVSLSF